MINARLAPHLAGIAGEIAKTDELIRAIHRGEQARRMESEITRPAPVKRVGSVRGSDHPDRVKHSLV
jgi:hypothetical protein